MTGRRVCDGQCRLHMVSSSTRDRGCHPQSNCVKWCVPLPPPCDAQVLPRPLAGFIAKSWDTYMWGCLVLLAFYSCMSKIRGKDVSCHMPLASRINRPSHLLDYLLSQRLSAGVTYLGQMITFAFKLWPQICSLSRGKS